MAQFSVQRAATSTRTRISIFAIKWDGANTSPAVVSKCGAAQAATTEVVDAPRGRADPSSGP
jgi:hypothetical protein